MIKPTDRKPTEFRKFALYKYLRVSLRDSLYSTVRSSLVLLVLAGATGVVTTGVSGCGRKSGPKPPEATAPSEVLFPAAGASTAGVTLTWQPPATDQTGGSSQLLTGFRIYRGEFTKGKETSFSLLKEIELNPDQQPPLTDFSFVDTAVQAGKTYDYAIEAVNDEGSGGRVSQVIRVSFRGTSSAIEMVAPPKDSEID